MIHNAISVKVDKFKTLGALDHWFYDALFFNMIKKVLGGRIRFMVSGGAPLNVEVKLILTAVFGAPIFEAYGMTEAAGCLTCTAFWDRNGGHVGGILPCNQM